MLQGLALQLSDALAQHLDFGEGGVPFRERVAQIDLERVDVLGR
jgi:hypothetical protein